MSDASPALTRAIVASAGTAGCQVLVEAVDARDWASATFVGQRHRLHLHVAPGPATTAWLAGLPEADWRLPRHLVAYVAAELCNDFAVVTALTIHES